LFFAKQASEDLKTKFPVAPPSSRSHPADPPRKKKLVMRNKRHSPYFPNRPLTWYQLTRKIQEKHLLLAQDCVPLWQSKSKIIETEVLSRAARAEIATAQFLAFRLI